MDELTQLELPPAFQHLLYVFQSTKYVCVAAITIMLYDHIITFITEVDLIWVCYPWQKSFNLGVEGIISCP
ncbi:hypothetical protein L218DRAFT_256471 [Marasmius fiardii PR-910]|nr:hypothetical protein L218DRAFT_256471 [Marasmius fiardii PR-910]